MRVHYCEDGIYTNHDESLHFMKDNNGNIICIESGEIMKVSKTNKSGEIIEIDYCLIEEE